MREPKKIGKRKQLKKNEIKNNYKYNAYLRNKLKILIKQLKFKELEMSVSPVFPEISWEQIKSNLIRKREYFTPLNVFKYMEFFIKNNPITDEDLRERLLVLQTIEISRHKLNKIWYGYKLENPTDTSVLLISELQKNMINYFNKFTMKMNVKILVENSITYVSIYNINLINSPSIFFAVFSDYGFFFCTKKNVSAEYIEAIVKGCGYNSCKRLKLMGRDLHSLMKLNLNKNRGAAHGNQLINTFVYDDANPIITNTGIDFRHHYTRRKYIEKCFGDESILIECLQVTNSSGFSVNTTTATTNNSNSNNNNNNNKIALKNNKIYLQWEFKSSNIMNLLKILSEKRVLVNPLPNYIKKIMISGKTQLEIKSLEKK